MSPTPSQKELRNENLATARLLQEERAARMYVRDYIDSGEHLIEAPEKLTFVFSGVRYYFSPLNPRMRMVEVNEFRRILNGD